MILRRWIASLTLAVYVISFHHPLASAQTQTARLEAKTLPAEQIISLAVPGALGRIQETYQGRQPQTVVILQDAHSIPEAQEHLRGLIEHYQKNAGLDLVALEGAEGELDAQLFRSFPDQERLREVLKVYQDKGELSGGVAAALINEGESVYHGMDDWSLYEQDVRFYRESQKNLTAAEGDLQRLIDRQTEEKNRIYSNELLTVDRELGRFYSNPAYFLNALRALAKIKAPEAGSSLALILEEAGKDPLGAGVAEAAIEKAAEEIRRQLSSSADKERLSLFNGKYQRYKTSELSAASFAEYLQTVAVQLQTPLGFPSKVLRQIEKEKKRQAIEGAYFFRQFETYSQSVKENLIQNEEQRFLDQAGARLGRLKKMVRLELTVEDWQLIQNALTDPAWTEEEKKLFSRLKAQRGFYQVAEKRDEVFIKNLMALMEQSKRQAVIAVAGGFHAEGLTQKLRDRGVSYVLIMPAFGAIGEKNNIYRDHMMGNVSWKGYFKVVDGRINLHDAFVRSVRDQLLLKTQNSMRTQDPQIPKTWRDQLIRDLARLGQVSRLHKYTRFLDEAGAGVEDPLTVQWRANIYSFVNGLRRLDSSGRLNEMNIRNLIKSTASIPLANGPVLLADYEVPAEQLGLDVFSLEGEAAEDLLEMSVPSLPSRGLYPGEEERGGDVSRVARSELRGVRRAVMQIAASAVFAIVLSFGVALQFWPASAEREVLKEIPAQLQIQTLEPLTVEDQMKATVLGMLRLIDPETGLVVDKAVVDENDRVFQITNDLDYTKTSPTNIGLEILAIVIARDRGWISQEESAEKLNKIISLLERMERIRGFWYNWYNLADLDSQGVPKVALNQFVSSVDNANLSAALMVLSSATEGTPLSERAEKLLDDQSWPFFYSRKTGLMSHGYDVAQREFSNYGYGVFNTEARLLSFIGVLQGVDQEVWDGMSREVLRDKSGQVEVVASWGGSLFESLFADIFMGAPDPIAQNNRDTVRIHRQTARDLNYPFWGWSPAQNAADPDLYAESGVPEIGARDRGKGYPLGAVSPYSSLLAARYMDGQSLNENLAAMRLKNPKVFSPMFGYRDAIHPETFAVSKYLLSLDKGMEIAGFDALLAASMKQSGTAETYFWQYLRKKKWDSRAAEMLKAEQENFDNAKQKPEEVRPNTALKFRSIYSLIDKDRRGGVNEGAWNHQSDIRHKFTLDLDKRESQVLEIEYDVTANGSYGGTFHQQPEALNPADYGASHITFSARGLGFYGRFKPSFKIELKRGGRVVQEAVIQDVTDRWQNFAFRLRPGLGKIDEIVTVFVNEPETANRGRLRIDDVSFAAEEKETAADQAGRSEVRQLPAEASAVILSAAALLYPLASLARTDSVAVLKAQQLASVYRQLGDGGFEAALLAQAEAFPTRVFDEVMASLIEAEPLTAPVAIGVVLPSGRGQLPAVFWKGFASAFGRGEVRELFKQGGRFDIQTEKDLAAKGIVPRAVKINQSHELLAPANQEAVPTALFDYTGLVDEMFLPLEVRDLQAVRRGPRETQFLGFLVGRILKTKADLLREQPALKSQPEELKKELLRALWAQGFSGLEMGLGRRPHSLSISGAAAMAVLQMLMSRSIESSA